MSCPRRTADPKSSSSALSLGANQHRSFRRANTRLAASSDTPSGTDTDIQSTKKKMSPLAYVNESTKFIVSGACLAVLITHPNVPVCWCLSGSVFNSLNSKLLKRLINESRPDGATKLDPGMPSSHAVSLSYLSVYAASALLLRGGGFPDVPGAWPVPVQGVQPGAAALVTAGLFLTWLRVHLGYHNWAQVCVGYGIGSVTALGWLWCGETVIGPSLVNDPASVRYLYWLVGFTTLIFLPVSLRWFGEARDWFVKRREAKAVKRE